VKRLVLLLAACGAAQQSSPAAKSLQLNASGAMVDIPGAVPAGYVTVVVFWAEWCGACTIMAGMLAVQIANEPRVIVRKVDVGEGSTAVARAYDISALPHFDIYDRKRRLRYVLVGNDCTRAPELARQLLAEP
jgi:thiol-disulfide isomerase/thioredoxin